MQKFHLFSYFNQQIVYQEFICILTYISSLISSHRFLIIKDTACYALNSKPCP